MVFKILATQKYFLWVLTMPGYGLFRHPKTQQSHLTDFHNICGYKSYHNEKKSLLMEECINYILPRYLYDTVHTKI